MERTRQTFSFQPVHLFSSPVVQETTFDFYKFRDKAKSESEEARTKAQMEQQLPQDEGAAAGLWELETSWAAAGNTGLGPPPIHQEHNLWLMLAAQIQPSKRTHSCKFYQN